MSRKIKKTTRAKAIIKANVDPLCSSCKHLTASGECSLGIIRLLEFGINLTQIKPNGFCIDYEKSEDN